MAGIIRSVGSLLQNGTGFGLLGLGSLGLIFLLMVLCYVFAWLSYKNYGYELSNEGLKVEKGVVYKKYVTIPYGRVQNVDIYRGILDRLLGLSDVHVQTAGMSGGGRGRARTEGRLPGLEVAEAERVRDELVRRVNSGKSGI